MKQSAIFTKTRKEAPKDEVSKNAILLIKAGFIHKEMAGVYSLLPLGLRVINKIENIIREEMNSMGGQEVHLSTLQEKEVWQASDRWSDENVDNWFKTKLKNETELGLGFTHEEPLTNLLVDHLNSYKDLPINIYQFQTKFRNELRAKSGIMRGREFLMKDLYSFNVDEEAHNTFYEKMKDSYNRIFDRIGIGEETFLTYASGGSFSEFSHEFQMITDAGEDTIYLDRKKGVAINDEIFSDEIVKELELNKDALEEVKTVEVGNIFTLGTKFSSTLGLTFQNKEGKQQEAFMGSYGIGVGRLMGAVVEKMSDEKGIIWPESISPFQIHLINVSPDNDKVNNLCEKIYSDLQKAEAEVLYDDRDARAGEKLADADLIGIPLRITIGSKSLENKSVEILNRAKGETKTVAPRKIVKTLKSSFLRKA